MYFRCSCDTRILPDRSVSLRASVDYNATSADVRPARLFVQVEFTLHIDIFARYSSFSMEKSGMFAINLKFAILTAQVALAKLSFVDAFASE